MCARWVAAVSESSGGYQSPVTQAVTTSKDWQASPSQSNSCTNPSPPAP